MSGYIQVKNFERFQHYKDRNPVWIKLYNDLLDDYQFGCLPDASKWLAVGIWLLASRYENRIPNDAEWIGRRVNARSPVDLAPLVSAGFITVCECEQDASNVLADCKQHACLEEETEKENNTPLNPPTGGGKKKAKKKRVPLEYTPEFEVAWALYPKRLGGNPKMGALKAWTASLNRGVSTDDLTTATRHYAQWVRDERKDGSEFVKMASTFYGPSEPWRDYLEPVRAQRRQTSGNPTVMSSAEMRAMVAEQQRRVG